MIFIGAGRGVVEKLTRLFYWFSADRKSLVRPFSCVCRRDCSGDTNGRVARHAPHRLPAHGAHAPRNQVPSPARVRWAHCTLNPKPYTLHPKLFSGEPSRAWWVLCARLRETPAGWCRVSYGGLRCVHASDVTDGTGVCAHVCECVCVRMCIYVCVRMCVPHKLQAHSREVGAAVSASSTPLGHLRSTQA